MATQITVITGTGSASYTVSTGARGPAASAAALTVVVADPNGTATATHLGQLCKATTAWWQWDGSLWIPIRLLTGEPITTDGTDYFAITHDGSSLGYTPFP